MDVSSARKGQRENKEDGGKQRNKGDVGEQEDTNVESEDVSGENLAQHRDERLLEDPRREASFSETSSLSHQLLSADSAVASPLELPRLQRDKEKSPADLGDGCPGHEDVRGGVQHWPSAEPGSEATVETVQGQLEVLRFDGKPKRKQGRRSRGVTSQQQDAVVESGEAKVEGIPRLQDETPVQAPLPELLLTQRFIRGGTVTSVPKQPQRKKEKTYASPGKSNPQRQKFRLQQPKQQSEEQPFKEAHKKSTEELQSEHQINVQREEQDPKDPNQGKRSDSGQRSDPPAQPKAQSTPPEEQDASHLKEPVFHNDIIKLKSLDLSFLDQADGWVLKLIKTKYFANVDAADPRMNQLRYLMSLIEDVRVSISQDVVTQEVQFVYRFLEQSNCSSLDELEATLRAHKSFRKHLCNYLTTKPFTRGGSRQASHISSGQSSSSTANNRPVRSASQGQQSKDSQQTEQKQIEHEVYSEQTAQAQAEYYSVNRSQNSQLTELAQAECNSEERYQKIEQTPTGHDVRDCPQQTEQTPTGHDVRDLPQQTEQTPTGHDVRDLPQQTGQTPTEHDVRDLPQQTEQTPTGHDVGDLPQQTEQTSTGLDVGDLPQKKEQTTTGHDVRDLPQQTEQTPTRHDVRDLPQQTEQTPTRHDVGDLPQQTEQTPTGHDVGDLPQQTEQTTTGHDVRDLPQQTEQTPTGHDVRDLPQQTEQTPTGHDVRDLPQQTEQTPTGYDVRDRPQQTEQTPTGHDVGDLPQQTEQTPTGHDVRDHTKQTEQTPTGNDIDLPQQTEQTSTGNYVGDLPQQTEQTSTGNDIDLPQQTEQTPTGNDIDLPQQTEQTPTGNDIDLPQQTEQTPTGSDIDLPQQTEQTPTGNDIDLPQQTEQTPTGNNIDLPQQTEQTPTGHDVRDLPQQTGQTPTEHDVRDLPQQTEQTEQAQTGNISGQSPSNTQWTNFQPFLGDSNVRPKVKAPQQPDPENTNEDLFRTFWQPPEFGIPVVTIFSVDQELTKAIDEAREKGDEVTATALAGVKGNFELADLIYTAFSPLVKTSEYESPPSQSLNEENRKREPIERQDSESSLQAIPGEDDTRNRSRESSDRTGTWQSKIRAYYKTIVPTELTEESLGPDPNAVRLRNDVICFRCGTKYRWPHLLECCHHFCFPCLVKMFNSIKRCIKCPRCSGITTSESPDFGPHSLKLDYSLCLQMLKFKLLPFCCTMCISGLDAIKYCQQCMAYLCWRCYIDHNRNISPWHALEKTDMKAGAKPDGEFWPMCAAHPGNFIERVCETCWKGVCSICCRGSHREHTIKGLEDVVATARERIRTLNPELTVIMYHHYRLLGDLLESHQRLLSIHRSERHRIDDLSNHCHEQIEIDRTRAISELQQTCDNLLSNLNTSLDEMQNYMETLKAFTEFVTRYLQYGSPSDIMYMYPHIKKRSYQLWEYYENNIRREFPIVRFNPAYLDVTNSMQEMFTGLNVEYNCYLTRLLEPQHVRDRHNEEQYRLEYRSEQHAPPARAGGDHEDAEADGDQEGAVRANVDVDIETLQSFRRIILPHCTAFGARGRGEYEFGEPSGVLYLHDCSLAVCDSKNHVILVYDENRKFVRTIGQLRRAPVFRARGDEADRPFLRTPGMLFFPYRMAQCPRSSHIVVVERPPGENIQIFTFEGRFVRCFGSYLMKNPRGIAIDETGRILILESRTMNLFTFTQEGQMISKSVLGNLEFPNDIATRNSIFYISDNRRHCVKYFNDQLKYLGSVGNESLTYYPISVGFNNLGHMIVTDNHNTFNITAFDENGALLYGFKSQAKHPNCYNVALHPQRPELAVTTRECEVLIFKYLDPGQQRVDLLASRAEPEYYIPQRPDAPVQRR